jgi:hypothetical protein
MSTAGTSAAGLLGSVLDGMDALFTRTAITHWRGRVREVAAIAPPAHRARAYRSMAQGSAPGTFHDLIISARNQHTVTSSQEPFVNELLTTFQSVALGAVVAIERDGEGAILEQPIAEVAAKDVWAQQGSNGTSRWLMWATGVRCTTCDSRYQLDDAAAVIAARRWSLTTAPAWIVDGRSRHLVDTAMDSRADTEARAQLEVVAPAFARLELPIIRLPYNLPHGAPNDRCQVCGADSWTTVSWRVLDDPLRLEAGA